MTSRIIPAAACLAGLLCVAAADAHDIVRRSTAEFPIAASVQVPAGAEWMMIGGTLPDAADPGAPPGSRARLGDTAAQARSVLDKIAAELEAAGFAMRDVVKMNVFLVGDPEREGVMDVTGLMSAYMAHFGPDRGGLPVRTTVQVAGLAVPGVLVSIDVVAARTPEHEHAHE